MEQNVKQNVGIDVSKEDFIACFCFQAVNGKLSYGASTKFSNNKTGLNQFVKWFRKHLDSTLPVRFTMEATGVYHELLAVHLHKLKFSVVVVLPNKVKYYAKSLNVKTKTDSVDARIIARMGIEQNLSLWHPPLKIYQELRSLTRYLQELKEQKIMINNHLEALSHSEFCTDFVIESNQKILNRINSQIDKCEIRIKQTIDKDSELSAKVKKLETIKGIGLITIAVIIAETQGFALFSNRKQLASYAGLDVVERQSGTSVKSKTRISKKGNKRIRTALYFPAIVASKYNQALKEDYQRIIQNKPYKKIGIVALQRKLLLLIYTLWKKDEEFNPFIQNFRKLGGEDILSSSGDSPKKTGS
ncbi:MAG: IS110 family transposase [Prevotellaceae bacterium]|nr:IS110 family transposase [Prevotellaceae bacterium]